MLGVPFNIASYGFRNFDIFKWKHKDVELTGYVPQPPIKLRVTV